MIQPVKSRTGTAPVMTSVPRGFLQRQCACGQHTIAGAECEECKEKRGMGLQRRPASEANPTTVPPIVHEVLRSPGQPLDAATRGFFEPRFGHDFSDVRVHTDSKAVQSAHAVSAMGYTVGRDMVFAAGQYEPLTSAGRRLLAHELTHVVQQSLSGDALHKQPTTLTHPSDASETEATRNATAITQKQPSHLSGTGQHLSVARLDIPLYDCPRRLAPVALRQAASSGLPGIHNGPADAYRHCYWSCEMVRQCSWLGAYAAGTGHELTDWTANESQMDLNNNAVGRDCGSNSSASCDTCCRAKLAGGQLTVLTTSAEGTGYYSEQPRPYISDTAIPHTSRYRATE